MQSPPVSPNEPERLPRWRRLWTRRGVLLMFAVSRLLVIMLIWLSRQIVERGPLSWCQKHAARRHSPRSPDEWDGFGIGSSQNTVRPADPRTSPRPFSRFIPCWFAASPHRARLASFQSDRSNGCLIAALALCRSRLDYDELICRRRNLPDVYPVSFFLSSAYTERLFSLSIGALLAARQGKWPGGRDVRRVFVGHARAGLVIGAPCLRVSAAMRGRGAEGALLLGPICSGSF